MRKIYALAVVAAAAAVASTSAIAAPAELVGVETIAVAQPPVVRQVLKYRTFRTTYRRVPVVVERDFYVVRKVRPVAVAPVAVATPGPLAVAAQIVTAPLAIAAAPVAVVFPGAF